MSQNLEYGDDGALQSLHHYPPNVSESNDAQDQAQLEVIDGSEAIFNMYLEMSLRVDKEMVESWNQDAKSILLFSGLFSATVAAALGSGVDPAVGPQDLSAAYLALIYQIVSLVYPLQSGLVSNFTIDTNTLNNFEQGFKNSDSFAHFQLVNTLWYSSLVISLTCALLAILSQQWARRYLMAVRQRDAPYNQARIREFLAEGIHDSGIALLVDAMWTSHQLSFVLFILGLLRLFFNNQDNMTFFIVLAWSLFWICLYLWMSMAGFLRKNSPYSTPLSSLVHRFSRLTLAFVAPYRHTQAQAASSNRVEGTLNLRKTTEESARRLLQGLDGRTLKWTFKSLNQDHEFERFFAGIPDFCDSRAVIDPVGLLLELNDDEQKLSQALIGLMHRTVTSHLISEPTRQQRINICARAIDAVPALVSWSILRRAFGEWEGLLRSVDSGSAILRMGGDRNSDPRTAFYARCIVAIVIARGQVYGDRWESLTTQFLTSDMKVWDGISRFTLCGYLEHGYSALLANLIFITRTILRFHSSHSQNVLSDVSSRTLREVLSNIDVRLASPEMQREYCRLWDDLVQMAQDGTSSHTPTIATEILRRLRKSYVALHESTDTSLFYTSPDDDDLFPLLGSSYPLCNIHNHRTSPQTQPPTTTNSTSPRSPRLSLSAPQNTIPQNVVAGATEDANEVSLPAEATPGLAVASSAPTAPHFPLDTQPSVEIPPTVQEDHDAPVAQSDRISSKLESPSFTPDAGPSAAVPNTNI
ncbi:hypothetical protein EDB85DRAFT_2145367 [Lactarius pseudohatsudake]|nr:hypothetical protein EDB85DRAFT_2145367 [Lactarius pseudohatsudake]